MDTDDSDNFEDEVIYLEESALSFRIGRRPWAQDFPSSDLSTGPARNIFGATPGSGKSKSTPRQPTSLVNIDDTLSFT